MGWLDTLATGLSCDDHGKDKTGRCHNIHSFLRVKKNESSIWLDKLLFVVAVRRRRSSPHKLLMLCRLLAAVTALTQETVGLPVANVGQDLNL